MTEVGARWVPFALSLRLLSGHRERFFTQQVSPVASRQGPALDFTDAADQVLTRVFKVRHAPCPAPLLWALPLGTTLGPTFLWNPTSSGVGAKGHACVHVRAHTHQGENVQMCAQTSLWLVCTGWDEHMGGGERMINTDPSWFYVEKDTLMGNAKAGKVSEADRGDNGVLWHTCTRAQKGEIKKCVCYNRFLQDA